VRKGKRGESSRLATEKGEKREGPDEFAVGYGGEKRKEILLIPVRKGGGSIHPGRNRGGRFSEEKKKRCAKTVQEGREDASAT